MCSKSANLGPAQQSSAGLLHLERWQYAIDTILKIATATMSREISQINDYDGVFKEELRFE